MSRSTTGAKARKERTAGSDDALIEQYKLEHPDEWQRYLAWNEFLEKGHHLGKKGTCIGCKAKWEKWQSLPVEGREACQCHPVG